MNTCQVGPGQIWRSVNSGWPHLTGVLWLVGAVEAQPTVDGGGDALLAHAQDRIGKNGALTAKTRG